MVPTMSEVQLRAPGRVNLIGEHTDYMDLPVLPMAIQRGITIRGSVVDEPGLVASSEAAQGVPVVLEPEAPLPDGWGRYLAGALRQLGSAARGRGAELYVDGDLPETGGLSSSSALTTGVLKALVLLWDLDLDDDEIVRRAIAAERIVGVESGGMDQTVIMFATAGTALRIDWDPPVRTVVSIPEGFSFVIGYSGAAAPKGGSARDEYNERVVSCRTAALLLGSVTGIDPGTPPVLRPFVDVDLEAALLPEHATAAEVAGRLDVDPDTLIRLTAGRFDPNRRLRVERAAAHVIEEARRVDAAQEALVAGDLAALGRLFDASHESLRTYGVSTPGLDAVTAAARAAGAAGARLTGAGFGGWAVAVCRPDLTDDVVSAMASAGSGPAFEVTPSAGIR
jgi:galactokinase